MNKCSFCNHCAVTDKGEKVCTKYLIYIGHGPYDYCDGPEYRISLRTVIIAAIAAAAVLSIIFSQL